ncbi:HpcH/HpaI aldolase/citrate lyase family protein [Mycolicibacterium diernhoferi]|uniref:CoA ester lyase n=1 Tax=Mycolicibacterium diernhoferi TaxID=1801 RepID=A0A1Q4H655_9MYCO|nr:CoA ester lyase [Mycolicibacterium diernhoferi]OJZ62871.1 CoA ester lyase [Mycolicibacterium diernhoferi]OPE55066.1 CoA ester lyase [Mycolicibacterium diernhoferi]PEG54687.1 CoA ester lyase [Mycolicibacterium diernhoferi]QYL22905.1 CoA ester lyase [Mycolicibacterium diernhoferi]
MTAGYDADVIRSARSLLFVPGNRPGRFPKAMAAQPDIVILDLEDAVAADEKATAREHIAEWFAAGRPGMVRINAADTPWHEADLELIRRHRVPVMLAKAESVEQIRHITDLAPGVSIIPLIETAAAVAAVGKLCTVEGVVRLAFGSIDFANQIGVDPDDRDALLLHRSMLVLGSAAAGLPAPIDGVTTSLTDSDAVTGDFTYARRLGMGAKLCIHPAQVAAVHAAATTTEADVQWAQKVIRSFDAANGSAAAVDGQMIDVPVVERARHILATAADR